MSDSTADRFCRVFAKLQAIDPGLEEPMRHQMRAIRNAAIQVIDNALSQAEQLAWAAEELPEAVKNAVEDAQLAASTTESKS